MILKSDPGHSHNAYQTCLCAESSSFNGSAIFIQGTKFTQSLHIVWSNSKGKQFCYNSNTSKGCLCSGCTYAHACMLCRLTGHLSLACSDGQPASS
jgi:hypothetical protein